MEATQSPSLSTLATRGALTTALAALMLAAIFFAWPRVSDWQQQRLAMRLVAELEQSPHVSIHGVLGEVATLGDPAIEALVVAATSQRADIALAARELIDHRLATWRIRAAAEAGFDLSRPAGLLAVALATHVDKLGPFGQQWATRLALDIVDLSAECPPDEAALLLASCSKVLGEVPALGPRMLTADRQTQEIEFPTRRRELPAVDLPPLLHEEPPPAGRTLSQSSTKATSAVANSSDLPLVPEGTPPQASPRQGPLASDWVPDWSARTSALEAIPQTPLVGDTENHAPGASDLVDVPSPQDMHELVSQLKREETRNLFDQLNGAERFTAAAIREVLTARGFGGEELAIAGRLADGDAHERLQLIDDLKVLPARTARRWLRELLDDEDADVRLKALTALATPNDPGLIPIARNLAVHDSDHRVTELASQIVRQAR